MVTDPVVVLAVMACGDAALLMTPTSVLPTEVLASTAYGTLPGTRSVTEPAVAVAVRVAGAAEKVTSIVPAATCKLALADDTFWPRIDPAMPVMLIGPDIAARSTSPASVCAVTCPVSELSRIVPALSLTRTVTDRGTVMS
jgi:hypothetical protein